MNFQKIGHRGRSSYVMFNEALNNVIPEERGYRINFVSFKRSKYTEQIEKMLLLKRNIKNTDSVYYA